MTRNKIGLVIVLFLLTAHVGFGQSDKERALELGHLAIELLEQAQKLDTESIDYPYELAYANYKKYQLLGNSYDFIGQPEVALQICQNGMVKFPQSGKFYLESGNIKYHHGAYQAAIDLWEKGIKVDGKNDFNARTDY